ncbi:uncharacterized protein LOC112087466 [Eutrema salsugineum]|uniref:uncharacterized protein LOC112087466 n=1 Tax=Eutrema salsugineum TaxID=72664 RepID=UPI000CED348F|nr:uncharacterized protein LOC112087466 [Eutrema salsugineum]
MADVGDRGRSPGDPPDVGMTWANKVAGQNVGGRLSPEKVVDAEFVRARLNLEFPDGEDGEAVITIGQEVLDAMNGLWKQCIVVKVLGRDVPITMLTRRLKEMWRPEILMGIAQGVGKPIKVDITTLNFERARFARVCVEVDLNKPLKGSVRVNGERYFVAYEGLTNICAGCGLYGHAIHSCPRRPVEEDALACVPSNAVLNGNVGHKSDVEFTKVSRGSRKTGPVQKLGTVVAGRVDKERERNLREIPQKHLVNITISNKFGELEVADIIEPKEREKNICSAANKENAVIRFNVQKEAGQTHNREERNGSFLGKGKGAQRVGPIEKKAQQNRGSWVCAEATESGK